MAGRSIELIEYLRNVMQEEGVDFLREAMAALSQEVMEADVSEQIGAHKHERTAERSNYRNGYREREWQTRVGEIRLEIPRVRQGSYLPGLLEPRKRAEQALLAVVQSAYVEGVSTRKVDDLLQSLGLTGIDKSRVSRICKGLDEVVERFKSRPLEGKYPYLWLDALYLKVRVNHHIRSMALVIAIVVKETGEREIIGFGVGASEEEAFWSQFLRGLVARGLSGVELVISDAHQGLCAAISHILAGATWQRCRVHLMRNLLAHVPKQDKSVVATAVRTIFAQADRAAAGQQLQEVVGALSVRWPKAARLLEEAECDVLAYMSFPAEHWTRLYSTNPLERLNREVKRRTDVVGVFANVEAVERLVGSLLIEIDDEWQVVRRYFSQESMLKLYEPNPQTLLAATPLRLAPVR